MNLQPILDAYKTVGVTWLDQILLSAEAVTRPGTANKVAAGRVQELCVVRGQKVVVDGDYGPGTTQAVRAVQRAAGLPATGEVDAATWLFLIGPLLAALRIPQIEGGFGDMVLRIARQHDLQNPHEIGGANRGPWVKLYMRGQHGANWPWCAGFVSFMLRQAALATGTKPLLGYELGCDQIAALAKTAGLFVREGEQPSGAGPSIFLVRSPKNSADWTHTGLGHSFTGAAFQTIEGNGNQSGGREGTEVVQLHRGYKGRDFVRLPNGPLSQLAAAAHPMFDTSDEDDDVVGVSLA